MIKICIVDDHNLFREGIKTILDRDPGMKICCEASNVADMMSAISKTKPDIILLDISMPGKSGLEGLKELKIYNPEIPVLMLSMYPEDRFAVRCLKAEAHGYLNKMALAKELISAIQKVVHQGKKYITPQVAEVLVEDFSSYKDKLPHEYLSDREEQIMMLIADGKKTNEIAEELHISIHTVHTYRSRIIKKLGLKSNIGITHYVIDNNLQE